MSQLTEGSFCTGINGLGIACSGVFGSRPAWFCEYDAAPSKVLAHHYPDVPNHGDLTATDWSQVEPVDIVTAGYPCQPFSTAGKRQGTDDERHIWTAIRDAIGTLRPRYVILENVRGHLSLGFDAVLGDLAGLGFDAEWRTVRSSDIGAPHRRERLFVLAQHPDRVAGQTPISQRDRAEQSGGEWPRTNTRRGATANADSESAWRDTGATLATENGREDEPLRSNRDRSSDGVATPADTNGSDGGPQASTGWHNVHERRVQQERDSHRRGNRGNEGVNWGKYAAAVQRWERITGTAAPEPLENGKRLNPALPQWMMGYPAGWLTDPAIGLSRAQQLRAIGNAVQSQAAALAIGSLVDRRALVAS